MAHSHPDSLRFAVTVFDVKSTHQRAHEAPPPENERVVIVLGPAPKKPSK
jgi:hypothetical protein